MDQNIKKELETLKTSIASADTKYKEIKANPAEITNLDEVRSCLDSMNYKFSYLVDEINYIYKYTQRLEELFYQHITNGHIPPISGPEKMSKAIKVLGLDGDYEVNKKQIWASKNGIVVNYTKPLI